VYGTLLYTLGCMQLGAGTYKGLTALDKNMHRSNALTTGLNVVSITPTGVQHLQF